MVSPPHLPPSSDPHGVPGAGSPIGQEAWRDYQPSHYVHVRRGPPAGLKLVAVVAIALLAVGGYWFVSFRVDPNSVYQDIADAVGKASCPSVPGEYELQFAVLPEGVEAYLRGAPEGLATCVERAVATTKLATGARDVILAGRVRVRAAGGKLSVAEVPRQMQRLDAEWSLGVLGEHIDDERAELKKVLDANFGLMLGCYVEAAMRQQRAVGTLAWHMEDEIALRMRVLPSGAVDGANVGRPGMTDKARDWTQSASFQTCTHELVRAMPWPSHDATTWEWVNTTFRLTPSQL